MTAWVRVALERGEGFGTLAADGSVTLHDGDMFGTSRPTGAVLAPAAVRLLAPVQPRKFIGLWNNFHARAAQEGNAIPEVPLYFLKSPDSIVGPGAPIRRPPRYDGRIVFEAELGIVIGRACHDADEAAAEAAIFGYTCVNDVTASDILRADPSFPQWARAKSCDSFGPCGPAVVTGLDWSALTVLARLNGRERQNYPASDMILSPARIVSLLSREMTLLPGDLIACGTSLGATAMRPGMTIEVEIPGIGILANPLAAEGAPA